MRAPFLIDEAYDRETASNGTSRYLAYLGINAGWFDALDQPGVTTDPVAFASAAFNVASSPTMAPGYVQAHPVISAASCSRSWEDGALLADVTLYASPPSELQALPGWGSWHTEHGGPVEPSGASLTRKPAMLTSVRLLFSVSTAQLYVPQDAPGELTVRDAKASVQRLVRLLNEQVRPVLARLEGGRG